MYMLNEKYSLNHGRLYFLSSKVQVKIENCWENIVFDQRKKKNMLASAKGK